MKRVLLVEDEPLICDLFIECFESLFEGAIECARTGVIGAQMLAGVQFDLAVIDVGLPEISGIELAGFAANENIPVLLVSGHPDTNDKLRRFGYPYLEKPFRMDELCAEAARVIGESRANILRVKASAAKMLAESQALTAAVMESRRLLHEIKAQQAVRDMDQPMRLALPSCRAEN